MRATAPNGHAGRRRRRRRQAVGDSRAVWAEGPKRGTVRIVAISLQPGRRQRRQAVGDSRAVWAEGPKRGK